jgi:hypothetical protein
MNNGSSAQWAPLVGPGAFPPAGLGAGIGVIGVAGTVRRRRSRQAASRPKVVQFSLTEEEFDQVSVAAARSGLARGAFAAGGDSGGGAGHAVQGGVAGA